MTTLTDAETRPGRTCPLAYRYSPSVFSRAPTLEAETLYVIGGLYGNVEALKEILAMKKMEESQGHAVTLFFNGDFNWFNVDADSFAAINEIVLEHMAIQGNVEAELTANSGLAGCGCAYPPYVCEAVVERSNRIMSRLREQAVHFQRLIQPLAALPMQATVTMGHQGIGIVHGDPESLSGWAFSAENMAPNQTGGLDGPQALHQATPLSQINDYFRQAQVRAFCSSHTCLPFAQDYLVDGQDCLVMNNGAAGMPNFRNTLYGLLTRISIRHDIPGNSLYGIAVEGLRFDAVPIHYDHTAWLRRFEKNWPPDSPAYLSYYQRITDGPNFDIIQATHGRVLNRRF